VDKGVFSHSLPSSGKFLAIMPDSAGMQHIDHKEKSVLSTLGRGCLSKSLVLERILAEERKQEVPHVTTTSLPRRF
jgi:hypothetical protein